MLDKKSIATPSYVINKKNLEKNMQIFKYIIDNTNAKILLSQKAFSNYFLYPFMGNYLSGTSSSGLYEARLGYEEMKDREVHVCSPAYTENEISELVEICDHIVFNTPIQWLKYKKIISNSKKEIHCGIRINPEYSEIKNPLYDPCSRYSRLGSTILQLMQYDEELFENEDGNNIDGIHFHTLCEHSLDTLERTLSVIENKFDKYLKKIKWINMGGGHYITKSNYDIQGLINLLNSFEKKYNLQIYLEPGEAIALNCGYLICTVLEIMNNEMNIAIVDTSATCHMPNIIEVPFQPSIENAGLLNEKKYNYRIGGISCLAGDIIGDYSFDYKLNTGDKLILDDMIVYSMVKNNTFNGVPLPSIAIEDDGGTKIIKSFDYHDFKTRL